MKGKVKFNIEKVNIPTEFVKAENVVIEVEYEATLNEITGTYDVIKKAVTEFPGLLNNLITGLIPVAKTLEDGQNEICEYRKKFMHHEGATAAPEENNK
jgi:stringent starvation protein B